MHSSRMHTTHSSSRLLGGLPQCMLGCPPWVWAWRPPRCGPGTPPPGQTPQLPPLGVGMETCKPCSDTTTPWYLQGMLGYYLQCMLGYHPHRYLKGMLGNNPTPCGQNSWHMILKILPCPKLCLRESVGKIKWQWWRRTSTVSDLILPSLDHGFITSGIISSALRSSPSFFSKYELSWSPFPVAFFILTCRNVKIMIRLRYLLISLHITFKIKFGGHQSFCGATGATVLDFQDFKARQDLLLMWFITCVQWSPQIHHCCITCWPLDGQYVYKNIGETWTQDRLCRNPTEWAKSARCNTYFVQKTYLDYRILNKYQRHKNQTGVHPNINDFDVSNGRNSGKNIHHLQTKQIKKFSPFYFKLVSSTILIYHNVN